MSEPSTTRVASDEGAVLTAAQACDLDLALGCALRPGHLLGGILDDGPSPAPDREEVVVALPSHLVAGLAAPFPLRDEEHTPLADVVALSTDPRRPDVTLAEVTRRRPREARPLALLALHLDLPVGTDPSTPPASTPERSVLVLLRPPLEEDGRLLDRFARDAATLAGRPLVLVPEGGPAQHHLPARPAVEIARHLLVRLGLEGTVRVAPLHLRDSVSDARLARGLVDRLAPGHGFVLGGPGVGDQQWLAAAGALDTAITDSSVPGVSEEVATVLRRWRPPAPGAGSW